MCINQKKPLNIVLIDDDIDDRALFKEMLKSVNPSITPYDFPNGISFIKHIGPATTLLSFDLIFLDINMPLKNGIECLKHLRSDPRFSEIPIIMLTTSASEEDIEASYAGKATLYVAKSFSFDQGALMLQTILREYEETGFKHITREMFARVSQKY